MPWRFLFVPPSPAREKSRKWGHASLGRASHAGDGWGRQKPNWTSRRRTKGMIVTFIKAITSNWRQCCANTSFLRPPCSRFAGRIVLGFV